MAKKTPIEKLDTAIAKVLDEYKDSINTNLDIITKKMGQKGAVALRQSSKETFPKGTGKYAKGWKFEYRYTRHSKRAVIYNEHYSLPHLLENNHVIRNGTGRVGTYIGRPHIQPVADELNKTFESEVIRSL